MAAKLSFELDKSLKQSAAIWTHECSVFYTSVLVNIDSQVLSANLQTATTWITPQISAKAVTSSTSEYNDGLENLLVHFIVQLFTLINHDSTQIRVEAALLLVNITNILNEKNPIPEKDLAVILSDLQIHGELDSVSKYFNLLGNRFSIMLVPLISGLECYQCCHDWKVRSAANIALSVLILHGTQFEERHLAAIWNFYFALKSIPLSQKIFPDRFIIIQALDKAAPLYASKDRPLAIAISDCLLRIPDKVFFP